MGPVDILINCAGFAVCGLFEETSVEDFKVNVLPKSLFIKIMKQHAAWARERGARKEEMTEGRKASRASKSKLGPLT